MTWLSIVHVEGIFAHFCLHRTFRGAIVIFRANFHSFPFLGHFPSDTTQVNVIFTVTVFARAWVIVRFSGTLDSLFQLRIPRTRLARAEKVGRVATIQRIVRPDNNHNILARPQIIESVINRSLFLRPRRHVRRTKFTSTELPNGGTSTPNRHLFRQF